MMLNMATLLVMIREHLPHPDSIMDPLLPVFSYVVFVELHNNHENWNGDICFTCLKDKKLKIRAK